MPFSNPGFRNFIIARFFFTLSMNMQGTLLAWYIYEITHDALYLGLTGLAEIFPFILTLFVGGLAADRFHRQRIMLASISGFLIISLLIYFLVASGVDAGGLWKLYFLIALTGICRGFLSPAQNALLGQISERKQLAKAATWNSAVFQSGAVIGPATGGFLYGMFGPVQSFLIVAILISISVLLIFGIRGIKSPSQKNQSEALLERLGKGVAYVWTHKLLFPAMVLDMVAVLFGGVVAVLPLFADQVLHTGPEGLGWLRAAPAIGSVLVSGILIRFPPGKNAGRRMIIAIVGFGLSNLLFALSNSFYWSLCLLFFAGMFDSYSMVVRGALLQLFTPDEMKGRVSAVNSIFIGSSNELGAFESGLAARFMGLVPSVVFGAFVTFASTGVAWFRAKDLSQLDLSQGES